MTRSSNLISALFAATALLLGGSPAWALSRVGVTLSSGTPTVYVDPCMPAPQVMSFSAQPATVMLGQSTVLSWSVQVPSGCNYMLVLDGRIVSTEGSLAVQPDADSVYTLTLSWGLNRELWTAANTAVFVDLPPDPADPTRKKVTLSTPSLPLFLQALRTPDTTLSIDDAVDLDLSGLQGIPVASGVRMLGGRTVTPGHPFRPGARLHTSTRPGHLFVVVGTDVRIAGLRIQGALSIDPPGIASDDADNSIAISLAPSSRGWMPIEIDHNEIYGWSGAGVEVVGNSPEPAVPVWFDDATSLLFYGMTPEPARIHHNYIHHNLHEGKLGYGVVIGGQGSHALIENNVFDWNRHAISGDGADFSGYRAYDNLVLANGGYNTWVAGFWIYTHQFDMHGQESWCLWAPGDKSCGKAGHDIDIRYNSFFYTSGPAIKVRGTPQLQPYGAVVRSNSFVHGNLGDAVEFAETGVLVGDDNETGATPTGNAVCDFDGDGKVDGFLTTGQSWWFSSDAGRGPWIFLRRSTAKLADVTLGYVDGDGLCDVTAGGVVYSDGTTPSSGLRAPRLSAGVALAR